MRPLLSLCLLGLTSSLISAETVDFYISCAGKDNGTGIFRSTLDTETGTVTVPELAAAQSGPGFLHLSSDGKRLLSTSSIKVTNEANGAMALFSVADDGALTKTGEAATSGRGACHVNFDATGKVAMAANYHFGGITSALVGDDGSLTAASHHEHEGSGPNEGRQKASHAHSIYAGPDNAYAYTADLGTDSIFIYKIDHSTGELTKAGEAKTPPGAGPRHMKFSKDGKYLYVLNELTVAISVYERIADGQLKKVQDLSTMSEGFDIKGMSCSEIVVHPNGQLVFAANRDTERKGRDAISAFKVGADNSLTLLGTVPAGISIPRNITLSPKGKWLIVSGQVTKALSIFAVNAESGELTKTGENVPCPKPMCVVFR